MLDLKPAEINGKTQDATPVIRENLQLLGTSSRGRDTRFQQLKKFFSKWNELYHILLPVSLSSCSGKVRDQARSGACLGPARQSFAGTSRGLGGDLAGTLQGRCRDLVGTLQGLSAPAKRPATVSHQAWREGSAQGWYAEVLARGLLR